MKKAQLAVETLLIYGVAILIVMLAIGALIGFGVLDLSSMLPNDCKINGVALTCTDYSVSSGNSVQIQLQNNMDSNVNVNQITIYGEDDMMGMWNATGAACSTLPPAVSLSVGSKNTFNLQSCTIGIKQGKKIKGKIVVNYNKVGSDIFRNATGTIMTTVN